MLITNDVSPSIVEKREVNLLHSHSQLLLQSNLYTGVQYAIAMANYSPRIATSLKIHVSQWCSNESLLTYMKSCFKLLGLHLLRNTLLFQLCLLLRILVFMQLPATWFLVLAIWSARLSSCNSCSGVLMAACLSLLWSCETMASRELANVSSSSLKWMVSSDSFFFLISCCYMD